MRPCSGTTPGDALLPRVPGVTLTDIPPLLRNEPGITRALGEPSARLAIVEVARPVSIAALAHLSQKRPLVVACPTGSMAGQMYDDLQQFVGPDEVALFPAWETLPFERVSPAVETMGQRLELLWRLRSGERCPKVIVAGVRALLQKLGPEAIDVEPITIRPGAVVDPDAVAAEIVACVTGETDLAPGATRVMPSP